MAKPESKMRRSATKTTPRSSRRAKTMVSYRESSTDNDAEASGLEPESDSDEPIAKRKVRKRSSHPRAEARLASSKRRRPATHSPRSSFASPRQREGKGIPQKRIRDGNGNLVSSPLHEFDESEKPGRIPNWASLPYQILVQIFHYASYPLFNEQTFQTSDSAAWLTEMARMCRSFSEPAITALYRSPPLVPMERAHLLRQLLIADSLPMTHNYRAKVEQIQMEVSMTAAYSLPGSGLLDFYGILYHCPRLLDLELYHQKDMSPYKHLDETIKWSYPDSLFCALEKNVTGSPTRLRSWRWNSRLGDKRRSIDKLVKIHETPSFSGLRKLAFVNYQRPKLRRWEEDGAREKMLADSLRVLSKLEHLVIESSTLVNGRLLPLLPSSLRHLELINCLELESDDLEAFLLSHGSQLRSIILHHNPSLGLSFLEVLGRACPYLETLELARTYHFGRLTLRDSRPHGPEVTQIQVLPEWPSSLQTIELTQLKFLDIETAEIFFASLLLSAGRLVNLRRLIIKAILDTQDWRDRSSVRETWVRAFDRKFKRRFVPPNPHLRSIDAYKAFKESRDDGPNERGEKRRGSDASGDCVASSSVGQLQASIDSGNGIDRVVLLSDEKVTRSIARRSTRLIPVKVSTRGRHSQTPSANDPEFLSDHSGSRPSSSEESPRKKVAGEQLDNPRKRERTYRSLRSTLRATVGDDTERFDSSDLDSDRHTTLTKRQKLGLEGDSTQGMCDVVSITIDNLRPSEKQFVEADFLDSEPEGDEDWDGTDDDGDEGGDYAW